MTGYEKINEKDIPWRDPKKKVKYIFRGPNIDWGIIRLKPGESMANKSHGHVEIDETFYFIEGNGLMIVNDEAMEAPQGSVFLIEPKEMHNIKNNSKNVLKVIFIKGEYKPDDKIE